MKMVQSSRLTFQAIITVISVVGVSAAIYAADTGAKYGTRDPRICKDKTQPRKGALSAEQARQYFICGAEYILAGKLYLIENVTVQVGEARPYNPNEDINFPNINTKFPIYPIRGSFKKYICDPIYLDRSNLNRNCSIYNYPNAKGACYKDNFGDWSCGMTDATTSELVESDAPPPTGAKQTKAPVDKKITQKKDKPRAQDKPKAETKEETGYPEPDFSAMEKWFEIVKYEYPEPTGREMYIYLKPKVENPPTEFQMEFRDKDGLPLQDKEVSYFHLMPGTNEATVGEMKKVYVQTPGEKALGQVVTAKVVRVVR